MENIKKDIAAKAKAHVEKDLKEFQKASEQGMLLLPNLGGQIYVERPESYEDYAKLYQTMVWVYTGIYSIASAAAMLPFKVQEKKNNRWETVEDHELLTLLNRPNKMQTWYDICEGTMIYLELSGNAYWEKAMSVNGKTGELYLVRPDRLSVVPDSKGAGVKEYTFQVKRYTKKKHFKPEEIVPFSYFNPLNDWYGQSGIKAATDDIIQEQYATKWNRSFFKNNAVPRGILSTEAGSISDIQRQRIKQSIQEYSKSADDTSKMMILPKGLKYQPIGTPPKDMEFFKLLETTRQAQLSALGVPPGKAGLLEHAKYANFFLQQQAFYRDTVQPKMKKVQGAINSFLVPEFGEGLRVVFDFDDVLKENANDLVDRVTKEIAYGIMTPNEAIRELGIGKEYTGGDEHYMMSSLVGAGEAVTGPEEREKRVQTGIEQLKEELKNMINAKDRQAEIEES